jgi:hypothetical protein
METFIILRSKTDDALEDFVKTQLKLQVKTKKLEKAERCYASAVKTHEKMCQTSTTVRKLERIFKKIKTYEERIEALAWEIDDLESECNLAAQTMHFAKRAERDHLATIVKNEIVA